MEVEINEHKLEELREWLRVIGQPCSGTKAQLVQRINEIPQEERGECPRKIVKRNSPKETPETITVVDNEVVTNQDDAADTEPAVNMADVVCELEVEMDQMRKLMEKLANENKMLKLANAVSAESNNATNDEESKMSISVLKGLIIDYDGSADAKLWAKQFENLSKSYNLNSHLKRVLFVGALKGKAQKWLHSMPDFITKDINQLLRELIEIFGIKINVLKIRKNFEDRKWRSGESFAFYCNEKCSLAAEINMSEEELLEYLIEGIPTANLRNQANLLCVNTKDQLLRAFSKVELKLSVVTGSPGNYTPSSNIRCYNCYTLGHYASECKKPKRERGSCFVCGSMSHRVAECPNKKKEVMTVEEEPNDYVRNFIICFKSGSKFKFSAACLIDSGSPVNFIKIKILKENKIQFDEKFPNLNYYGINKTKLKIFGKIDCYIMICEQIVNINLLVVANESMSFDAVLGRSFLKSSKAKLVFLNDISKGSGKGCEEDFKKIEKSHCDEIVNYENITEDYEDNFENYEHNNIGESYDHKNDYGNYDCESIYENNDYERIYENFDYKNNNDNDKNIETNQNLEEKEAILEILAIDYDNNEKDICIGESLNESIKKTFISMFKKTYVNPLRPVEPELKCSMKLILDNCKPFHFAARRLSYHEKNELQKLLDAYLEKGYIRPSFSEYASAIVLTPKKTGGLRMCIDFRTLNKITAKDNYPLPVIDDLLDKLANKSYFSKLDLKDGFFHVFMHEDSVKFTSFVTPLGQYEWLRMPFGLKNAPSVFQRYVNSVFADMIRQDKLIMYMDDILVATVDIDEHIEIMREVFDRLVRNKLELRIDKCEFLQSSVKYLGYVVDCNGIKPDGKGVEAIRNFPVPRNVHDVQRFLGLGSYFRRFIANFSIIAKPLYDLLRKDKVFTFKEAELKSFDEIKEKLSQYPILAIFDPKHETELHCDASAIGFGAILLQQKDDGKMHPVFFFSKRTTEVESRYHSFELETLAIVYALKRFRVYLVGKSFKIVTDCNSLTLALNKKEINPRISRWALELQNFDYTLEHRSNSRMQHVDALSRSAYIMILETNTLEENLIICQNKDENLCNIKKSLEEQENKNYELRNGILYKKFDKNTILFYVPVAMEKNILYKYHNEMGHVGVNKTIDLIKKSYWFPNMKTKIENHIQNCLKCIAFSSKNRVEGFIHNIPKSTLPFEVIHIDHFGPIENSGRAKKYILVVIDAGTKFVRLYDTKTTNTKEVVIALKDYFRSYSRPRVVISDRGSCFTSSEFNEFLVSINVSHVKIATGSPQANGQVERLNRSLKPMLAKLVEVKENKSWDKVLENVEFTINNTICRSIGQYPSIMLFGVAQRGKIIDALKENYIDDLKVQLERNFNHIRDCAKIKQEKMQEYNENYANKTRLSPKKFKNGDYVMVRNFDSNIGGPKKLIPKFKGPYEVVKVLENDRYIVQDVENLQQTQIPYRGVWAISNIRPWLGSSNG